jgi:4-amino-4-deoxychorismate lyase
MTVVAALLNGLPIDPRQPALPISERGFQYGDGLYETMRLQLGKIHLLDDHYQRLAHGAQRLNIVAPYKPQWLAELAMLMQHHQDSALKEGAINDGIVKFTLTRGHSERGYRPPLYAMPTRLWQLFAAPPRSDIGITVRWCETRLSRNAQFAGIKHCNRLEQVMAQSEWSDPAIAEGLMLDTEGELIGGTMSNVFLCIDNIWVTPDLRYCGIAGVMRAALLRSMTASGIAVEQRSVHGDEVAEADELFLCNAVRGIQPVLSLEQRQWPVGVMTRQLMSVWSGAQ